MLRGGRAMLTVWLFLALLSVGEGTICFETGPSMGMSIVAEETGMACVTVTRSTGDPDTFGYRAVAGTATVDEDFTPVPAGARPSDRPPRFQSISFQNSSLTAEVCVTIESDNIACEILSQETIFIELDRRVASVCDDDGLDPLFTVQIEDSTRLPVRFTQTEVRVSEAEQTVQIVVEAITGDAFIINSADLMLVEDPNESGCLESGSSETIQFGCNLPGSCSDLGGQQPTMVTVSPSLVGNNDISDCHRFCSLVLERAPSTQCKFAFPDGNRLSLVVEDDEDVFVSFSTTFTQVREDNGSLALTLRSTRAASQPFTVHINSRILPPGDNTATVDDFTPGPYEVTFPAGQTSQVLNIPITNDELLEADTNDFDVLIVNFTSNCSIRSRSPNEVLVQILDEDRVSVDFPSEPLAALEDSGELAFILRSTKRSEVEYEVAVRSQQSSRSAAIATDGEDFISATSVVRFGPGNQTSTSALVQLVVDSFPEQNETFSLRLAQPAGQEAPGMLYSRIELPRIPVTATIQNDDPPHEVCFVQPEYRVEEDDGGVDVSVRLNGPSARANITIFVSARSTGNGETDASVTPPGDDILETEWEVTIPAGDNGTTFQISVIADDLAEADETFELELTVLEEPYFAVSCATESTATVVIEDDDPVMIGVTAVDSRVEGEHQVYDVTFSTQTPFDIPFEITVRPTNGTATGGEDFEPDPITLSFSASRTSVNASIPIINDAIEEEPETFLVIAEPGSSNLTIVINQADSSLMILDNEAIHYFDSVMLTIARNESDGSVPVTVNRRGYIQRESTVLIQPVIGSTPNAAGSEDFAIDSVTVTFATGEESVTAAISLTQDMISELEEQFFLRLIERTSIGGALVEDLVVPPNEATVLIRDPGDVVCVSFSQATYTVPEDIGMVEIVVEADKDFTFPFQVEVSLSPDTAQLGTDYLNESFNVTFEPGSRTATGSILIVNDDILEVKNETVLMVLSPSEGNAKDVCVATPGTATLMIIDDDNMAVYFEMASYTVSEGSNISICILANISSDIPVVVMVTSQQMIDFSLEASLVTFAPGETRKCIQFSALSDNVKENTERIPLTIMLMEQECVSVGDPGETVVNIIDATGLSIEFEQAYYPVTEGDSTMVNVVLSNQYTTAFLVRIVPERIGDINFNGFLQFTPPLTSRSIRVDALADDVAEEMENITLSIDLSIPETQSFGVVLGSQSTTVIGVESTEVIVETFASTLYSVVEGQTAEVQLNSSIPAETNYTIQVVQVVGLEDFEVLNDGIATFTPGSQVATVQIRALTDEIQEPDEVFTIEARLTDSSTSLGVVIGGNGQADVVVKDMTAAVTVGFDPTTYSVTEGSSVDIMLRASSDFSVPFNVTLTSDGDEDITFQSSVVTFQPSSRTVSVTLDAVTDEIQEPPEIVTLDFEISATIDVGKGSNSQATVTVNDNSPPIIVNFQQDAYSVIEGDTVEIVLVANRPSSVPFAVTVRPDTQGDDYEFVSNSTVTFLSGTLLSSVQLKALDDSVKEPDETYSFSLSVADNGGVDVIVGNFSSTQVTITDPTSISISFEEATYQLIEGGDVRVTLIANGTSILPFTVNITTTPGSAEETDYDSGPYQVQFSPEESTASTLIRSLPDACIEQQEVFTLNIQLSAELQNMNIHLGAQDNATVELTDPTVFRVSFNQSSYQTDEGSSFATAVVANICYEGSFDVEIRTMDLTATAGEDYLLPSTLLQFRGEESLPLSISTVNDNMPESTEEFQAGLSISSSDMGLNVTADGSFVPFTIIDDDEEPSRVSFSSSQYSTSEGDTLVVGFVVTGSTRTVTGNVTVTASNGTAMSPFDFSFTTATVNPATDTISIPILIDDIIEMEETFGLELTISTGMDLQLGNISQATVSIADVNLITVNDTVTADPVFAVPIHVVEYDPTELNPGELSMCYEIHGDEDKWFNFISDKCLSLNAYYKRGKVFNRIGHVIRELGILAEDDNRQCRQVLAVINDDGDCSVMVDGSEVNVSNSGGLRVNKNRNRIRVSVPNCDNHRVVIWASCEDFFGNQIMRLVVTRGLNLRPTSHGFLGQFWNIDVALEKFNETADELLKQKEGSFPHYIVHLRPPAPAQARSFVGELYSTKWDNTPEPCIYVGSNQAGTGRSDLPPLGTIVEGAYDDYIVGGAFDYTYQFTRFESESCRPDPIMEA